MTLCSNCELYREMYQAAKRDAEEAWVYASELEAKLFKTIEELEVDLAKAVKKLKSAREHIAYSAPDWHNRTRKMVAEIDSTLAEIGEGHG